MVKVDLKLCGNPTTITADLVGGHIKISMDSPCSKIKAYAEAIKELSVRDIGKDIAENPIFIKASSTKVTPTCAVPIGVATAAWAEAGMISKNLLNTLGPISISLIK